jgi:hypothetical protein
MLMDDFDISWRKLLNICPRWVRVCVPASVLVGACLNVLAKLFNGGFTNMLNLQNLSLYDWPLIGCVLVFPAAFVWRQYTGAMNSPLDRAEEYVRIIKLGMREAELSKTDKKFVWRSMMLKLVQDFQVSASPPPVHEIISQTIKQEESA